MGKSTASESFPPQLLQLGSCKADGQSIVHLTDAPSIEGLYQVCGSHPWLYIQRLDQNDSIDLRSTRPGHVCLVQRVKAWDAASGPVRANDPRCHAFIFLRPSLPSLSRASVRSESLLAGGDLLLARSRCQTAVMEVLDSSSNTLEPRRLFETVASEWWFVAEVFVTSLANVGPLLDRFTARRFDTSTKIVLVPWKDATHIFSGLHKSRRSDFDHDPAPDINMKTAMVVRNERGFFLHKDVDEQVASLEEKLMVGLLPRAISSLVPLRRLLDHRVIGHYIDFASDEHPNPYVERMTLRPVSDAWEFTFAFVRAERGTRADLKFELEKHVTVTPNMIVPRIYQVTGEFDYLISCYTLGPAGVEELHHALMNLPLEGTPSILRARIPHPRSSERVDKLSEPAREATLALFRNSVDSRHFWSEIADLRRWWTSRERSQRAALRLQSCRVSPRALSVFRHPHDLDVDPRGVPDSVEGLGFGVTWEPSDRKLGAAFVRLYPKSLRLMDQLHSAVRSRTSQDRGVSEYHEIMFDYFLAERGEIVGIARFEERAELERFLVRVSPFCLRTEFHFMLDRIAPIPSLGLEVACAPCIAPSSDSLYPRPVDCAHCGRYVRTPPEDKSLRLRVDLRRRVRGDADVRQRKIARRVKIGILDLRFQLADLEALGAIPPIASLDGREVEFEPNAPWRNGSKDNLAQHFAESLVRLVNSEELGDAEVVVLPEYCVPLAVAQHLVRNVGHARRRAERFLVLGSHLNWRGYNASPIIHLRDDDRTVYVQEKLTPAEAMGEQTVVAQWGTASFMFRTVFGNIAVPICVDAYRMHPAFVDVDLVLVPSFDPGRRKLPRHLRGESVYVTRVVAYANGAGVFAKDQEGRSDSFVADGETVHYSGSGSRVRVGGFEGRVLTREVDLFEHDYRRARSRKGRDVRGVIPIHVDLWPAAERARAAGGLEGRLTELVNAAGVKRRLGRLSEFLTLDWADAEARWSPRDP